jgi:DNA-binding transcriptional LysR family regulator
MLDRMNLLFRFQAIAEAGSMRKAAEVLNIAQPALSRSLGQLEKVYGQPLLERHARGVRPTGFGVRLLSTISRLSRDWELAEHELASSGHSAEGRLRIVAGPLWAAVVLPVILGRLHERHPNLTVEIKPTTGESSLPDLLEGRIDMSFGGLFPLERGSGLIVTRAFTSVCDRIIARADHPIHSRAPNDYMAVLDYPWIIYTEDPIYEAETLHAVMERTGAMPPVRARTTSLLAAMRLLQYGDYLCMLPDAAVLGMPGGVIRPVPIDLGHRASASGARYRQAAAHYQPLQTLLDLCADYFDAEESRQ